MTSSDAHLPFAQKAADDIAAGNHTGAIAALKQAIKVNPHYFRGWIILGELLYSAGYYAEAVQVTRAAEQFDPLQHQFGAIQSHMQANRLADAAGLAEQMLQAEPGHARATFTLAHIAQRQGAPEKQRDILADGLIHSPANIFLRQLMISAYEACGEYQNAVQAAKHLCDIEESFDTLHALMAILTKYGQNEDALAAADRAGKYTSDHVDHQADVDFIRGQILRILGRRDDSVTAFRRSIATNSQSALPWWGLADMKTYAFAAQDRDQLHTMATDPRLAPAHRCVAAFAFAKASEERADPAATFRRYNDANNLYPGHKFDATRFTAAIGRIKETVDANTMAPQGPSAADAPTPIFIVGLPRSGSTLLEQILSSHSQIEGTMEQPVLPSIKRAAHLMCQEKFGGDYLTHLHQLDARDLANLADRYRHESALFRQTDRPYFTDKLPHNFEHVGLIHKILPEAIIIDIRRDPLDCGFSLYKQYFTQGSEFSYDLASIAAYYNGYVDLMAHWDQLLPGKVHRIRYEHLVQSPKDIIGHMFGHMGLQFEEACLDFHETERAVRTASSEQVRQPLYQTGVGAWEPFANDLAPLRDALSPAALEGLPST